MEKLAEQTCVPCNLGWSDLGSWDDIAELPAAQTAAADRAQIVTVGADRSFVYSQTKKLFAIVGVDDLILIDTPDALLAVRRGQSQRVREATEAAAKTNPGIEKNHVFEIRPWGGFVVLSDEPHYKSKHIYIEPGARISYQSHAKRAEHWIVVRGSGEVTLDDRAIPVEAGSSVFIPIGAKHRVRCTGSENLEFIEVQTGSYFGEDDIVRYKDDYDRV
jgi:mannose-1-phosphate guanylyltransferase/mannose-1-phosphate guanylyltransferase/mannose-6-phosphate isomerase